MNESDQSGRDQDTVKHSKSIIKNKPLNRLATSKSVKSEARIRKVKFVDQSLKVPLCTVHEFERLDSEDLSAEEHASGSCFCIIY